MYNESELAREAKALIKRHLKLNDGAAQGHVDVMSDGDLADIVAANDYPLADRPEVIRSVLARPVLSPGWNAEDEAAYELEPPAAAANLVTPPDPEPSAAAAQSDAPAVTPEEASPPAEADEPIVEEADDLDGTVVVD